VGACKIGDARKESEKAALRTGKKHLAEFLLNLLQRGAENPARYSANVEFIGDEDKNRKKSAPLCFG